MPKVNCSNCGKGVEGKYSQHELWSKVHHSKISRQTAVYSDYTESRESPGFLCISDVESSGNYPESES